MTFFDAQKMLVYTRPNMRASWLCNYFDSSPSSCMTCLCLITHNPPSPAPSSMALCCSCNGKLTWAESKDFHSNGPLSSAPSAVTVCSGGSPAATATATATTAPTHQAWTHSCCSQCWPFHLGEILSIVLCFCLSSTSCIQNLISTCHGKDNVAR